MYGLSLTYIQPGADPLSSIMGDMTVTIVEL